MMQYSLLSYAHVLEIIYMYKRRTNLGGIFVTGSIYILHSRYYRYGHIQTINCLQMDIPPTLFVASNVWVGPISKSMIVSFATVYFYYCLTHLDDEVEYIWKRKWDIGKVLYIMTRYSGISFFVFLCLTEISLGWKTISDERYLYLPIVGHTFIPIVKDLLSVSFTLFGGVIMIMAEVILQICVYAIYGKNKWILLISVLMNMVSLTICALQTFGYLDVVTNSGCIVYISFCTDAAITFVKRDDAYFDMTIARKAKYQFWCKRGSEEVLKAHDIMEVMAKDSTNYFIILFSVSAIETIAAFVTEVHIANSPAPWMNPYNILHWLLNVYQTMAVAVMTILAPRMLINIRSEMYNPDNLSFPVSTLTWDGSPALESFAVVPSGAQFRVELYGCYVTNFLWADI
ncbi:hypothetical protein PNOK_0913100 [Pyrrhoderma noxium]|uniref:DUF6533 domain-containing protein n=1 Tax=Pyrrhoderma noxium TaxID=2282107 RepID=A0A286U716_9AGAM|nr:hypothetical protein PNOK_0913100 [Pyrrhoderma noxium]